MRTYMYGAFMPRIASTLAQLRASTQGYLLAYVFTWK